MSIARKPWAKGYRFFLSSKRYMFKWCQFPEGLRECFHTFVRFKWSTFAGANTKISQILGTKNLGLGFFCAPTDWNCWKFVFFSNFERFGHTLFSFISETMRSTVYCLIWPVFFVMNIYFIAALCLPTWGHPLHGETRGLPMALAMGWVSSWLATSGSLAFLPPKQKTKCSKSFPGGVDSSTKNLAPKKHPSPPLARFTLPPKFGRSLGASSQDSRKWLIGPWWS